MDINILLFLQDFRNGTGAMLTGFLSNRPYGIQTLAASTPKATQIVTSEAERNSRTSGLKEGVK